MLWQHFSFLVLKQWDWLTFTSQSHKSCICVSELRVSVFRCLLNLLIVRFVSCFFDMKSFRFFGHLRNKTKNLLTSVEINTDYLRRCRNDLLGPNSSINIYESEQLLLLVRTRTPKNLIFLCHKDVQLRTALGNDEQEKDFVHVAHKVH